jgi:hypothetical protein
MMRKALSFSRSHIIRVSRSIGSRVFKTANKLLHATRKPGARVAPLNVDGSRVSTSVKIRDSFNPRGST